MPNPLPYVAQSSFENVLQYLPGVVADIDLSANQYCFVKYTTTGTITLAGAGDRACGVLQDKPKAGDAALVAAVGQTPVRAGGAFNMGDPIKSDANGNAIVGTIGTDTICAVADQAASAANTLATVHLKRA